MPSITSVVVTSQRQRKTVGQLCTERAIMLNNVLRKQNEKNDNYFSVEKRFVGTFVLLYRRKKQTLLLVLIPWNRAKS